MPMKGGDHIGSGMDAKTTAARPKSMVIAGNGAVLYARTDAFVEVGVACEGARDKDVRQGQVGDGALDVYTPKNFLSPEVMEAPAFFWRWLSRPLEGRRTRRKSS